MKTDKINIWVSETLKYSLTTASYFLQALTHRSFCQAHNERLEFLGDAILDLIIGQALFEQLPDADEGILSRYRAELVKGDNLAKLAMDIDLGEYLRLGAGEEKTGGRRRASNLAGAFEALIGAIYCDSNLERCSEVVLALFALDLNNIEVTANRKDAKTALQEYMQARHLALPNYQLIQSDGQQHKQQFTIALSVTCCKEIVEAVGSSKKQAQQLAAEKMLSLLENIDSQ